MSILSRETGLYDTVEEKVNKRISEIKEKMERNGLDRLDLFTWDYRPGKMRCPVLNLT